MSREYVVEEAPGSGIVIPGGVHTYFLDLKPGYTTPMVSLTVDGTYR